MARIKNQQRKSPAPTPEQRAEDEDLAQFCRAAAVQVFERLDREEAAAGCAMDYSSPAWPQPLSSEEIRVHPCHLWLRLKSRVRRFFKKPEE